MNPSPNDKDPSLRDRDDDRSNRDPVTGAPNFHPVGTAVGAAAGGIAAANVAAGALAAGPVGAVVGAAVGAVAGGLGGKAIAEHLDPEEIDQVWRERYASEPYHRGGLDYEDYAPAYRLGAEARRRYPGAFEEVEPALAEEYERRRGTSRLGWQDARAAARAAWDSDRP